MKKTFKFLFAVVAILAVIMSLCIPAFASTVTTDDEFLGIPQSIDYFKTAYKEHIGQNPDVSVNKSFYGYMSQDVATLFPSTIIPDASGNYELHDTIRSDYHRLISNAYTEEDGYTTLDIDRDVYLTGGRAFSYFSNPIIYELIDQGFGAQIATASIDGLALSEFGSKLFVYNPALTQGELRLRVRVSELERIDDSMTGVATYGYYSGILLYPVVGGGYLPITFEYLTTGFTELARPLQPSSSVEARISSVPCALTNHNNFNKLNIYQEVYNQADSLTKLKLRAPSELVNEVACIQDYTVRMVCSPYYKSGKWTVEYGRPFALDGLTSLNAEDMDERIPRCTRFCLALPTTDSGATREGETLDEFLNKITINAPSVDISDFNWVAFVHSIFKGIMETQILPGLYVYHIVGTAIAIPLVLWVLKLFAGG